MRGWKLVMPLYCLYRAQLLPFWFGYSTTPEINPKLSWRFFTSHHGVWISQRSPRLRVSVGDTCQSSCRNVARTLARCPQVPPLTPPPIWDDRPSRKSASPAPLPEPAVASGLGPAVYRPSKVNVPASPLFPE